MLSIRGFYHGACFRCGWTATIQWTLELQTVHGASFDLRGGCHRHTESGTGSTPVPDGVDHRAKPRTPSRNLRFTTPPQYDPRSGPYHSPKQTAQNTAIHASFRRGSLCWSPWLRARPPCSGARRRRVRAIPCTMRCACGGERLFSKGGGPFFSNGGKAKWRMFTRPRPS